MAGRRAFGLRVLKAASAAAAVLALLGLTPAGIWLLSRAGEVVAPLLGWRLQIGGAGGSLATAARLRDVAVSNAQLGLEAGATEVRLDPWSWRLSLISPRVRWVLAEGDAPAPAPEVTGPDTVRLPLQRLPALDVDGGQLELQWPGPDGVALRLGDMDLRYSRQSPRLLRVDIGQWSVAAGSRRAAGEGGARLVLEPTAVSLEDAWLRAEVEGGGEGTLRAHGRLDLTPGRALTATATAAGAGPSIDSARVDLSLTGGLEPLRLALTARGAGSAPSLGDLSLRLAGRVDGDVAILDSLHLAVAGGTVEGSAAYRLADGQVTARVEATHLQLERLPLGGLGGTVSGRFAADGVGDSLAASARLRAEGLSGIARQPVDLEIDGQLEAGGAALLTAHSQRLGRLAAQGRVSLDTGRYDLALQGRLDAAPWVGQSLPVELSGQMSPDTLLVDLRAATLPFGAVPPGPVSARLLLREFRYLEASASVGRGQLAIRARTDLADGRLDTLRAEARQLPLSHLSAAVGGTAVGGASASGELGTGARGKARLQVDDLRLSGWSAGAVTLTAATAGGRARLDLTGEAIQARAEIDTAGRTRIEATLSGARLHRPASSPGAPADSLRLAARLAAAGNLADLASATASADIDEAEVTVGGWSLRLLAPTRLEYDKGRSRLDAARLATPLGALRVEGQTRGDTLALSGAIDSLETAGLPQVAAQGRAHFTVGGTVGRPRVDLRVGLEEVRLAGRPVGAVEARLDLSDSLRSALELRSDPDAEPSLRLSLSAPAAPFLPGGLATGSERAQVTVAARELDATALASYAVGDSTRLTASLEAQVWLPAAQLQEGVRWGDLAGSLQLQSLLLDRERVRVRLGSPAVAGLAEGTLSLEGFDFPVEVYRRDSDAFEPAGAIQLAGRMDAADAGVQLRVRDLDLTAVALALPGRHTALAGTLSGQATFSGTLEAPSLEAEAAADLEVLGRLRARLRGAPSGWDGEASWVTPAEDSLALWAAVPTAGGWPDWGGMRLRARSEGIDLLVLLDQVPELETLTGTVRLDLEAESLGARPRLRGRVEVEDLQLAFLDVTPGYRFPQGRLAFDGSRGELADFVGATTRGRGRIELTGSVDLTSLDAIDYHLRLTAADLPARYEDIFDAPDVDLDLALGSDGTGSLLEGSVRLEGPAAEIQLVDLTAPPVPPPPAVPSAFLENTRLNVYVDLDQLHTRSELSDIVLAGQARVYGSFYKPRFQGEVEVVEGNVIVLNREFAFTRGRIALDRLVPTYSILDLVYDPILLDPELDLEAVAKVNDADETREVTLSITGPVRNAAPRLTSPGLGDTEVLRLLAFGTTNQSAGDVSYTGALYAAAGQLLLSRQVQRVGLDEFLLLPSGTALGTVGRSAVRVGKYFSWPLPIWVRYEAISADPSLGQFEVEYRVTKYLAIDASAHSQYELYGVGLGLSRDF